MGQTLAKAAEYTSVAESGEKKLALVKTNEDILNKIITFTETYPGMNTVFTLCFFKNWFEQQWFWYWRIHSNGLHGGDNFYGQVLTPQSNTKPRRHKYKRILVQLQAHAQLKITQ